MNSIRRFILLSLCVLFFSPAPKQICAQRRSREIRNPSVSIGYVHYRPVKYESEKVIESQNEGPNKGGLVFLYVKNISDQSCQHIHQCAGTTVALPTSCKTSEFFEKSPHSRAGKHPDFQVTSWSSRRNIALSFRHALYSRFLLSFD